MATSSSALRPKPSPLPWRRGLLVLDDDPTLRRTVCAIADRAGWAAIGAATYVDGKALLGSENFDCILTDVVVEDIPVAGFLRALANIRYAAPILLTGAGNHAVRTAAADFAFGLGLNACYPVAKPIAASGLEGRLTRIGERLEGGITGCCFRDCFWRKLPGAPDA
ncbi:hypothetical protein [Rhodoplanes roseus]|uniref:Response regulatory domain-containing protein n=1 Tax=Rhodoplanes roseus TaxID=29409 RepID=A0A327L309_9BRAD|nr:hypothetical protein [Rhodoplanes roseus]RAI44881.1 hypothetical protein CH341_06945 [Rhodoplanes roseus]